MFHNNNCNIYSILIVNKSMQRENISIYHSIWNKPKRIGIHMVYRICYVVMKRHWEYILLITVEKRKGILYSCSISIRSFKIWSFLRLYLNCWLIMDWRVILRRKRYKFWRGRWIIRWIRLKMMQRHWIFRLLRKSWCKLRLLCILGRLRIWGGILLEKCLNNFSLICNCTLLKIESVLNYLLLHRLVTTQMKAKLLKSSTKTFFEIQITSFLRAIKR